MKAFSSNKKGLYGLVFAVCFTITIIWMMVQTQSFNDVVVSFLSFKSHLIVLPKNKSKGLYPIRVHIFNKVDGHFSKNSFARCNDKCIETSGTDNYNSSKYVLFLAPRIGKVPPKKLQGQVWIFYGHESPIHHNTKKFDLWKKLVNFTVTQRRDSDVFHGYGEFKKVHRNKDNINLTFFRKENPKFLVPVKLSWLVSNCHTQARRRKYVDTLIKEPNVLVDIYGDCGSLKCPKNQETSCMNHLNTKYPYYLSFENSLCVDYITEKSFKVYMDNINMIPIVRGDKYSYEKFLPRKSYINVNEFPSVHQLTQKLKYILEDEILFKSFFHWRNDFNFTWVEDIFCQLCDFLIKSENTGNKKFYEDYTQWLNGYKERYICHDPTDV